MSKTTRQKQEKILYFEGAGWSDGDSNNAFIDNGRIRTAFHLTNGKRVYLEILGTLRTKDSPPCHQWEYTGIVTACFYITDEVPNDDGNKHSLRLSDRRKYFEYTEVAVLKFVNNLGASFTAVKVLPDLGGYRVFPENYVRSGVERVNYGDEFHFDLEMTARREAVFGKVYETEMAELAYDRATGGNRLAHSPGGNDHPNFSLWVDEQDPGLLHLLRHFIGCNKHWSIRTDVGDKLEDWMATATETPLGKYEC